MTHLHSSPTPQSQTIFNLLSLELLMKELPQYLYKKKKPALNLNNCNQFYFSKTNVRQTFSITWIPKDNSEKNEDKRDNQGVQNQKENIHVNKKIQESYQVFQILIKPSSFNGSQVSLLEGQISFPCFYPSHPLGKAATGKVIFQAIRAKQLRSSITVICKTSIFK